MIETNEILIYYLQDLTNKDIKDKFCCVKFYNDVTINEYKIYFEDLYFKFCSSLSPVNFKMFLNDMLHYRLVVKKLNFITNKLIDFFDVAMIDLLHNVENKRDLDNFQVDDGVQNNEVGIK